MFNYDFSATDLEYFLIILTRVGCFFYTAPFFGISNTPSRIKTGIAIYMSILIYQFVVPHERLVYSTILGYAILVIKEAATGILMGFCMNILSYVTQLAGQLIDMDIGLSMVSVFDPVSRQQTGFSGSMYQYGMLLILIISGLDHYVISALVESFKRIPVGGAVFNWDRLLEVILKVIFDVMNLGFRIFLPIFAAMLLLNVVLGILAKVAPQMNMFTVGIQIKILVGLTVVYLTIIMIPRLSEIVFDEMKVLITDVIEALG
ncbi:MAG: flagellar biosynthetic protein FliR [Lachnospiraceae bacterium]|nr:flagellar biosynthetic protein FliR [Lachnospiraceae bacterium]